MFLGHANKGQNEDGYFRVGTSLGVPTVPGSM